MSLKSCESKENSISPIRGVGVLLEFSNKRQRTDISELMIFEGLS